MTAPPPHGQLRGQAVLDALATADPMDLVRAHADPLRQIKKGTLPSGRRVAFMRDPATRDALDRMGLPMPFDHTPWFDLPRNEATNEQVRAHVPVDLVTPFLCCG